VGITAIKTNQNQVENQNQVDQNHFLQATTKQKSGVALVVLPDPFRGLGA